MEDLSKQYSAEELLEVVNRNYNARFVGKRLRKARQQAGLTQREAAMSLGVTPQSVCNWERGFSDISLRNAHRLMTLYKMCATRYMPGIDGLVTPMNYNKED